MSEKFVFISSITFILFLKKIIYLSEWNELKKDSFLHTARSISTF